MEGGAKSAESSPPRSICIHGAHRPMRSVGEAARDADWLAARGEVGQVVGGQPMEAEEGERGKANRASMCTDAFLS